MKEFKFEDFDIDFRNPLGVGAFSAVYKATRKNSNEVYAIKRISIENLNENEIQEIKIICSQFEKEIKDKKCEYSSYDYEYVILKFTINFLNYVKETSN